MDASFLHGVIDVILSREYAFDNQVVDAGPKEIHVDPYRLKVLAEGSKAPLEAVVILLQVLILDEVLALFVDAVVCKLAKDVCLRILGRVLLTCEPYKAFLVNVDPEGLVWGDHHVDPQVKFVAID